ncbi:hypothetical protein WJX82_007603 [Trebouxia sp. C0006]
MCVSAATLNLQEARKLEWATAISDEEDELPTSRTPLGLLLGGLEDDTDHQKPGFTPTPPASASPHRSHIHHVASEAEYLLGHLHKAKTQCSMGRFYAEVHQVQDRELSHLYKIREDLTQRQVHLTSEEHELQARVEQQRDQHLQILRQEHSTKADRQLQVQTQEQERQRQVEAHNQQLRRQQQLREQQQHAEHQREDQQRAQQQREQQHREQQEREQQQREQQQLQQQQAQQQQQQAQAQSSQLQQPTQLAQIQQSQSQQRGPQAPQQLAQPPQNGSATAAAADGGGNAEPSRMLRISDSAAQHEALYRAKLQQAQDTVREYVASNEHKKERRDIDKQLTKITQQISGTQYNVKSKANTIVALFSQLSEVQRVYAYLQLAKRFLFQCENQISLNQPSCFPYAEVAVAVAQTHPGFAELMIARLHEVCPLTVPKYHMFKKATAEQHYEQMGYHKVTDPKTGKEGYELPDRYLQRVGGFVTFYAALMQSELWPLRSPNGISSAWQYMARLLNSLPANRTSATALYALLQTAGYRLHSVYKDQFIKMLRCIYDSFWTALQKSADPDVRATAARIKQFVMDHTYKEPPEGSELPEYDQSTDVGLA